MKVGDSLFILLLSECLLNRLTEVRSNPVLSGDASWALYTIKVLAWPLLLRLLLKLGILAFNYIDPSFSDVLRRVI